MAQGRLLRSPSQQHPYNPVPVHRVQEICVSKCPIFVTSDSRGSNRKSLISKGIRAWRWSCSLLEQDQETPLIVIVLLAAILMLVGITAVSALDFTDGKRR